MMEGVSSSREEPVNHCVVQGSFNKVFMAGEGSNISVNLFEEQQQSNRDSGYDDDTSPMDSTANEQENADERDRDVEHPVPMEMDNAVTSCIVKGSDNMVVMSGDGSNIKVNIDREAVDNIPEGVDENHADINANNNNINSNLYPVQQDTDDLQPTKEKLLEDAIDAGERPVAHVQPVPREKQNEQEIPSNFNPNSHNAMPSRTPDKSSPVTDPPASCSKRKVEDGCNEMCKKQKLNDTSLQECAIGSCQTNYQVNVEGANNTAITAGSGSTINLTYYQCKHSHDKRKSDDINAVNIDNVDGEALKKTGMMPFFKRISKHIGSSSNKWKQLARELPMVAYEYLEREIRVLEKTQATTEQKAFAVLVKWWKGNTGAISMKKSLVVALRYIKLPWLASSLENEIQQGLI